MSAKKYLGPIMVLVHIIILGFIFIQLFGLFDLDASRIVAYTPESLLLSFIIVISLYCLKTVVLVIPMVALYISAGVIFPIGLAFIVTCAGMFVEMTLGYLIGKRLGREKMKSRIEGSPRLKRIIEHRKISSITGCFLLRFMPLQYDLVSMFYGASSLKYPNFVLSTFLGAAPGMISLVLVGESLTTPFSKEFLIPFCVSAVVCISALCLYRKWEKSKAQ